METEAILTELQPYIPAGILLIGGLISLLVVRNYLKDKDSWKYKASMFLALLFGILMAYEAIVNYGQWRLITSIFVVLAAFTMIMRPFRDIQFAAVLSMLVMCIVYLALAGLNGYMLFDSYDMSEFSTGWPRAILAFIAGAVVYMILSYANALMTILAKFFNLWPVLAILAILCIVESIFMLLGYGSIVDYVYHGDLELIIG